MTTIVDQGMRAYYAQRAGEYDDWWLGTGLFAERERPGWTSEVEALVELVQSLAPARWLDVACGTGFLTRHLRGEITAIDQSAAMVAITQSRLPEARIRVGEATPLAFGDGAFDYVFTSHFYGHLRPGEREAFLAEARRVSRGLVLVDSARQPNAPGEQQQERFLNDGSRHSVYKRFFEGRDLLAELGGGELLHCGRWFVVATTNG